jgi:hypothetical protein
LPGSGSPDLVASTVTTQALTVSSINGFLPGSGNPDLVASTVTVNSSVQEGEGFQFYVAVGTSVSDPRSTIQHSYDGQNWFPAESGGFDNNAGDIYGLGVATNGTTWVAAGASSDATSTLQYSSDGINWTAANSGGFDSGYAFSVAYSAALGQWLALGITGGDSTSTMQVSVDGSNWTGVNSNGFSGYAFGASYSDTQNQWVAVGANFDDFTSTIQTSPDGLNWTSATTGGFSGPGLGVLTTPTLWIAAGTADDHYSTLQWTTDFSNWLPAVTGGFDDLDGINVAWNSNTGSPFYVAVGASSNDPTSSIQWSTDGSNWNPALSGGFQAGEAAGIVYNPDDGIWTAVGKAAGGVNTIQTSTDGSNWNPVQSGGFHNNGSLAGTRVAYYLQAPETITASTIISGGSITTLALTVSSINCVPAGQGYTDTTTFQYNYMDSVKGFQTGVPLSNESTIGYVLNRPNAPIRYFNILFNGSNNGDIYAFYASTSVYTPYYFSTSVAGSTDFTEQALVPPISTASSQIVPLYLSTATGLTLYSVTLGFN